MNNELNKLSLAVNSAIVEEEKEAHVLAVGGGKGGGGKTFTCETMGTALVDLGYSVLIVDLDQQRTCVFWWNRRVDFVEAELADIEARRGSIEQMLEDVKVISGISMARHKLEKDIERYYQLIKMKNLIVVDIDISVQEKMNAIVSRNGGVETMLSDVESLEGVGREVLEADIETYYRLDALKKAGEMYDWFDFRNLINDEITNFDYIIIDTPGHLDNVSLQENVMGICDIAVFPTKTTLVDMEQMPRNKELTISIKNKYDLDFKAVSVVLVKDKSNNKYNDYSLLDDVADTLPVLSLDGVDTVLALRTSGLKANDVGCTALEFGNDKDEQESIRRFGRAIVATLNNELEGN